MYFSGESKLVSNHTAHPQQGGTASKMMFVNNFSNGHFYPAQSHDFLISAKINYTFPLYYGTIIETFFIPGGYHANFPEIGCRAQRQHFDSQIRLRQISAVPQGPCGSKEDPNGGLGRAYWSKDRRDLQNVQLQDQEILLRHSPFSSREQDSRFNAQKNWSKTTSKTDYRIRETGHSTTIEYRQKHVPNDSYSESRRFSSQITSGGSSSLRLWDYQKKTNTTQVKERSRALLTPETIEIIDASKKTQNIEVTRQSIQTNLEALLKKGFTTTHAGGFFFIPYLMELDLYNALGQLSAPKTTGIPNERVALQLIFEPLFGYKKGIRTVDPVSQTDFGVLSGLPFICSPATEYRFLAESTTERSESFQKHQAKRLLNLNYITGNILNMDGHSIKLFSRKGMKNSYLSKDQAYGKAIRTFYTQDQATNKPLFAKAAYSGTTVAQVTPQLVEANKEILGKSFLCVCDKEWFIGKLLDQLDQIHGVQVLLPLKRTAKRLQEMEAIPFEKFKYRYENQPIAKLVTDIDGFTGKMNLFVKRNDDDTFFALITNKKYLQPPESMEIFRKRWNIENFFNENTFLGLDRLPSLELNAIQTALTLKMVSYHIVDNFRINLPDHFSKMKPESIYENFIQNVQGKVQIKKDKLQVDIYGFKHQAVVAPLFRNLEQKLINKEVDPRIPWLNNYALNFSFK